MPIIECDQLDLARTADSGQCFRMNLKEDGRYLVQAGSKLVFVKEVSPHRFRFSCTRRDLDAFWRPYFDLDADYSAFTRLIDQSDAFLTAAARYADGMRILRQTPWEALICFIISQRKSIPAIKGCVESLCRAFGTPIGHTGLYAFPSPRGLAKADESALRACALGYRAPYVKETARLVAQKKIDLEKLKQESDETVLNALCTLPGVGIKVANCVLLFGYHRLCAFPRDVWILRVEKAHYGGRFPEEKYAGCAGLMQQYMFCFGKSREYRQWKEENSGQADV